MSLPFEIYRNSIRIDEDLLDLVALKEDNFITTTNVDALFLRNGFAKDRLYTPQGDYARIQCRRPCSDQTWPSEPVIKGLLPLVDPLIRLQSQGDSKCN